ncbi:MAG: metal ABC transporter ATP-binding protein [Rhizobiaceae bacterium]|nr:metal ABC transporter ATP-binding protein [Rhizobiaceae bacterium]
MTDNALIRLNNVGMERGGRWLVRGVTFDIMPAQIVTLIGPNGSGKSTTAKMAIGVSTPSEGEAKRRSDLRIGYVPQKLNIDWTFPLTVERFIHLTGRIDKTAVEEALAMTGVAHLRNNQINNLSGGEFQRVLLAHAIARRPNLLVLDEPVQGVDFNGEMELYDLIVEIRDKLNCGVLLISHDLHLVMASTDLVVCLNGHVCCQGTPMVVAESPEYHELFGARATGLVRYQHQHDHTHLPDGRVLHQDGSITDHCHPDDGHHNHDHNAQAEGKSHVG